MKRILLVRHAKSSWKNTEIPDFDRPLNGRGKKDAPFMARLISQKENKPALLLSSPALRASLTAKVFADAFGYPKSEIVFDKEIYFGDEDSIFNTLSKLDDALDTVVLFGHNPNFTNLTNWFCGSDIENVPTCGVCAMAFDVKKWKGINKGLARLEYFDYPKMYRIDAAPEREWRED